MLPISLRSPRRLGLAATVVVFFIVLLSLLLTVCVPNSVPNLSTVGLTIYPHSPPQTAESSDHG